MELLAPIQERYGELRADDAELRRLLALGADKAAEEAAPTLARDVRRHGLRQALSSRSACTSSAVSSRHSPGPRPSSVSVA